MLKHHFLIAFRNLKKHKGSFFINLVGLSTGLACALIIYLWVDSEKQFDKFHAKDSQLYQVMQLSKENGQVVVHNHTQGLLAEAMKKDLPEVEVSVPMMDLVKENMTGVLKAGDKTLRSGGIFAGKDFFNVFSFKLLQGKPGSVLADKSNMVISDDLAISLFGSTDNAVGKSIEWEITGEKRQASVTGVFHKVPANSSLQFDYVLTYDMLISEIWTNGQKWWNEGALTYLQLKKGTDLAAFNNKIKDFVKKYHAESSFTCFARPYSSAYLYGKYDEGVQSGGRIEYVRLFSIAALFILVIACINFMNLSTAKASRRLKEVGIRKTIGSTRRMLVMQFLSEAIVMSFLSLIVASLLVIAFLPLFNALTDKQLVFPFNINVILSLIGVTLLTGLLAGSYPAFYLSGFNPIAVLKGRLKNSWGELLARKGLVVFQFTISLVLIVSVIVVYKQVDFVQSANPGYNKDNVIYFDKEGTTNKNTQAFLAELKQIPGVVNASSIQENIIYEGGGSSTYGLQWPGKADKDKVDFVVRAVDFDMLETLGIQVKEGRSFSRSFGAEDKSVVFNETAIKIMNLKNPIGTTIKMWGKELTIVGVVKDFHISSFHEKIFPLLFYYDPENTYSVMAKIEAGKEKQTLSSIESFYKKYNPGYAFQYKFMDNMYQAQYVSEQRVSSLSGYFAGLAILISCLGLFGLAAFNAEIRTKEIGVRKVLGASVSSVTVLLSKDFFKLIIIAALIAFPLAWWVMNEWLNGFAYKIDIGAGVFIIAFVAIVLLTILTVGFQAIKAAIANPVKSLRTE
jgi:ABC-type antimicrobial peptide transport system permease subunit